MCDCTSLVEAIKKDRKERDRAIADIVDGNDPCGIAKMVYHVYRRHCNKCKNIWTWEDLLYTTLLRLIASIERGNEPRKQDCRPFLFQIAKFVCWEWNRDEEDGPSKEEPPSPEKPVPPRPANPNFPIEDLAVLRKLVPELDLATEACLGEIGAKCKLLLNLRFFDDETTSDPEELSVALKEAGYEVSPHVIPQEISNCKAKLRACLIRKLGGYYEEHF